MVCISRNVNAGEEKQKKNSNIRILSAFVGWKFEVNFGFFYIKHQLHLAVLTDDSGARLGQCDGSIG